MAPGFDQCQGGTVDRERVAEVLGLDSRYDGWLAQLEDHTTPGPSAAAGRPGTSNPATPGTEYAGLAPLSRETTARLLARLGCPPGAVTDTVQSLPQPASDPERWWLLERSYQRLVATMGDLEANLGRWPALPASLGLAGTCFPLHLFAACTPAVRARHAALGVPEDVSWATLADLGRHVEIQRRLTGETGVDVFWWMTLHLRAVLFEVGPLQYVPYRMGRGPEQPSPWYRPSEAGPRGAGFRPGDLALSLHIPMRTDLSPASCSASMTRAAAVFDRLYPGRGRRLLTCSTWLLDDQLRAYLPAGSNIVRFQSMFEMVPGWGEADQAVTDFVFAKRGVPARPGPGLSRLQQAVLEHFASGRHFRWRTGWRVLAAGPPGAAPPPP